ncbi:hypothetical protein [Streptomyces sp. NPDC047972]|uniref:hypothetical protein n=1 Tax=Streptomyces sp. NPDC047972 TaxID=3365493 RepID=UPI003715CF6C
MVGFLNGYDVASDRVLLDGLREWFAAKLGYGTNLVYWVLAKKLIFPDGCPEEPWSPAIEQQAVAGLIGLIDEYFDHLAGDQEGRRETV